MTRNRICTLAGVWLASCALGANAESGLFDTWRGYSTGEGFDTATGYFPQQHALADLDGDGDLDAAFANSDWFSPKISVIMNIGEGVYAQPVSYPTPRGSVDILAADFSGDGLPDLVATDYDGMVTTNTLSYFKNLGNGVFAPRIGISGTPKPGSLEAIDFDGDGDLDIASLREELFSAGAVTITLNNGTGSFTSGPTFSTGQNSMRMASGDLNGDGLVDLVIHTYQGAPPAKAMVLFHTGAGYSAPVTINTASAGTSGGFCKPAIADVDLDGDQDVLTVISAGLALVRNNGNGTFAPAQTLQLSVSGVNAITVADVTGDTWPDITVAARQLETLVGNGAGGFLPTSYARVQSSGDWPIDIDAADIDGDRDLDLLVTNRDSVQFNVHRNPGPPHNGDFQPVALHPIGLNITFTVDAGDVDGDGDLDVVTGGGTNDAFPQVAIFLNNGDGSLAPPIVYDADRTLMELRLKDLNGDKMDDLIWIPWRGTPPYHFYTALADGSGSFAPRQTWPINTCGSSDIDAFDLDNDGDLDVIVSENLGCPGDFGSAKRFYFARNNGDGTFQLLPPYVFNTIAHAVGVGDFNRDGFLDITSGIEVAYGHGDFTFDESFNVSVGLDVAVGDFNGDDWPDLAGIFEYEQERITVRLNNGSAGGPGAFGPIQERRASYSPYLDGLTGVVIGDADGDGDTDIFGSNAGSHDFSYYANNGNGTFQPHLRFGVSGGFSNGSGPLDSVACDLNGDGGLDLVAIAERPIAPSSVVAVLFGPTPTSVPGDVTGDGAVNVNDLLAVINAWEACPSPCPADLNNDEHVNVDDLLMVINNWS